MPGDPQQAVTIERDANDLVYFANAREIECKTLERAGPKELQDIFNHGIYSRVMRATDANEVSSRSHLIFTVRIEKRSKKAPSEKVVVGKLSFIDLAGSESLVKIGNNRKVYEEGLSINESLQCLGFVIRELAKGKPKERVNYNVHVLTMAMRDSLGGNAKTLMIVNISPSIYNLTQTRSSLEFAKQTGKIENKAGVLIEQDKPREIKKTDAASFKEAFGKDIDDYEDDESEGSEVDLDPAARSDA